MPKYIFALLFVFTFSAHAADNSPALEDVIEQVNSSVFSVISDLTTDNQALGAGFLIDNDGFVVTNYHVTEDASKITLEDIYGNQYPAKIVGSDKKTDIALLKAENQIEATPANFADSDEVRVGNRVFAIGNPFGLGNSVSLGIISAKERNIEKGPYDNFLQTDATINQGNSGGPLFNLDGDIIGMNTAIFSENGQYAGIGFATPANTVKWIISQLKKHGKVTRGWLGFSVKQIRSKETSGNILVVSELAEDSPASEAGLAVGDIISELGEIPLDNLRLFSLEISKLAPKTEIPAIIIRDGKQLDLTIISSVMKEENDSAEDFGLDTSEKAENELKTPPLSFEEMGIDKNSVIKSQPINSLGITAYFDEKTREMVIVKIDKESPLQPKDVKIGDRIIDINETPIFGIEDFNAKIQQHLDKQNLILKFRNKTDIYRVVLSKGLTK
ncbi:MAG: trypsin-like peptidase domain-containing protein [Alphaproteobacteria bacterium]|nr:trypsin-like peptidase domain-containing protein [Alphaproteobacteria bacterium]